MRETPGPLPDPAGSDQESVWAFPRPAIAEPTGLLLRVEFDGRVVAETRRGVRTIETSHPPSYYFPVDDVDVAMLRPARGESLCEWKGAARYLDVVGPTRTAGSAAWSYRAPTPASPRSRGISRSIPRRWPRALSAASASWRSPGIFMAAGSRRE